MATNQKTTPSEPVSPLMPATIVVVFMTILTLGGSAFFDMPKWAYGLLVMLGLLGNLLFAILITTSRMLEELRKQTASRPQAGYPVIEIDD